ncbi:MAG: nuclear transport factor 2 family protein [Methanoregula sp.]|uniref:nuclear transport factor 2 family protein n=1 Tax=Methanoregula sp. TaxID=2052170 RepID=UPI003BB003C2
MKDERETNRRIVEEFYNLSLNLGRPEEAAKKYLGPYYRQHNPGAADGAEAFIGFVREFRHAFPGLRFDFRRFIAKDDMVVVHSHLVREPGDRGVAVMDIFRIENNRIVEHWDVLQEVPEKAANSNTMF